MNIYPKTGIPDIWKIIDFNLLGVASIYDYTGIDGGLELKIKKGDKVMMAIGSGEINTDLLRIGGDIDLDMNLGLPVKDIDNG